MGFSIPTTYPALDAGGHTVRSNELIRSDDTNDGGPESVLLGDRVIRARRLRVHWTYQEERSGITSTTYADVVTDLPIRPNKNSSGTLILKALIKNGKIQATHSAQGAKTANDTSGNYVEVTLTWITVASDTDATIDIEFASQSGSSADLVGCTLYMDDMSAIT